jgi:hypothetical protein
VSQTTQTVQNTISTSPLRLARKALSGPMLRRFLRIAELWGLSVNEQMTLLGVASRSTFFRWKRTEDVVLPKDTLERIAYIIGIYGVLRIILPDERAAHAWIRQPNAAPLFGGRSALSRMLSGHVSDLYVVRQYLDTQRRGWA